MEETSRSVEDKNALEILKSTTKHTGERYETALLWKEDDITLPNNRVVAEKQLFSLERRLAQNEGLASAYRDTIESDLRKGYAKRLSRDEASAPVNTSGSSHITLLLTRTNPARFGGYSMLHPNSKAHL